jgi:hypothetical protein
MPDTESGGEVQDYRVMDDDLLRTDITKRREWYFNNTKEEGRKYGFDFVSDEPLTSLMTFKKGDVTVYFFYNTFFPTTKNRSLERLLPGTDSIYIQGFSPSFDIERVTPRVNTVFLSDTTGIFPYSKECLRKGDDETIINFLYENYVEGLKYALIEEYKVYKDPKDITYYCCNILDCYHKQLTMRVDKDHLKYLYKEDPRGEYLTMPRHYSTKRKRIELVRATRDGSSRQSAKSRKTRHRKSKRGKKSYRKSRK